MTPYAQRRGRLRRLLKQSQLPAMLVTSEVNVTYLTGFTGDSSYLLLTGDQALLLSDTRYTEQISEEAPDLEMEIRDSTLSLSRLVSNVVAATGVGQLAVEGDALSKNEFERLTREISSAELVATNGLVEGLREIKDRGELAEIRRSIEMAERTFAVITAALRGDQSERQVAHNLEHQIRTFGGQGCAFDPIVAVGPRAALPHARPTDQLIGDSPFVLFDWGARAGLYTSDLTRLVVTGKIPPKLERIYGVVLKAQLAAISLIRPGVPASEVDAAARKVISKSGHGKRFGHGLGHGFGLEIHESPRMSPVNDRPLQAGMVVTVEPGIYLPGWGGVRIEDDVLVTKDGHEVLTSVPKEFEQCTVQL